jgi:hypothetical protein
MLYAKFSLLFFKIACFTNIPTVGSFRYHTDVSTLLIVVYCQPAVTGLVLSTCSEEEISESLADSDSNVILMIQIMNIEADPLLEHCVQRNPFSEVSLIETVLWELVLLLSSGDGLSLCCFFPFVLLTFLVQGGQSIGHRFYMCNCHLVHRRTVAMTPVNSLNLLLASQFNISGFCSVIDFSLIFI